MLPGPGTSTPAAYVFVSARDVVDHWSNAQIYLADVSGRFVANITNDAHTNSAPTLSPDGKTILFVSHRDHGAQLFTMNLDGSNVRQLTKGQLSPNLPRWSIDHHVAFVGTSSGQTAIYVMNDDGGEPVAITKPSQNEADDAGLAFIHGGKTIVFSRYDTTTQDRDLYAIAVEGGGAPVRLTNTPKISETMPVVSHDGRLLAYRATHTSPTVETIPVRAIDTWSLVAEVRLPPPVRFNVSGIDFSADDRRLLFGADATDVGGSLQNLHGEIFSIGFDGSDLVRITKNAAYDGQPVSLFAR